MLTIRVFSDEVIDPELFFLLVLIYSEAFSGPPWNENWSVEDSEAALQKILSSGSFDLAVSMKEGEITGFGIGIPLSDAYDLNWFEGLGVPVDGTYYIADLATSVNHRATGSCLAYTAALVDAAESRGYERIAVRTLRGNEPVLRTASRLGFTPLAEGIVTFDGRSTERVVYSRALRSESPQQKDHA